MALRICSRSSYGPQAAADRSRLQANPAITPLIAERW